MRRFIATMVNMLSAVAVVVTLSLLQMHFPNEAITSIISVTNFESTKEFEEIFKERINNLFTLVNLKNCFESNGTYNNDLIVAESIEKNGIIKKWTIKNCIDEARKHGLYIDKNYNIDVQADKDAIPFSKDVTYNFMFKTYPSKSRTGSSTEEDFITEFMATLAKYYKYTHLLGSTSSNFDYRLIYYNDYDVETNEYSNTVLTTNEILESDCFLYVSSKDNIISSNIESVNSNTLKTIKSLNPFVDKSFSLYCYVNTKYPVNDEFRQLYISMQEEKNNYAVLLTTLIYASITFIISLALTLIFILSTKKIVNESSRLFYIIPTEFYVILYILIILSSFFLINKLISSPMFIDYDMSYVKIYLYIMIIYVPTILLFTILASKFGNDTLMPISLKAIKENAENGTSYLNPGVLFSCIFIPVILFLGVSIYLIYLYTITNDIRILIIGAFILIATIGFCIYLLLLHSAFNKAIEVQVKSNEMRTSLIANVSHDIKTPLTTILNYTNLISEEISNPSRTMIKKLESYSSEIVSKSHRLNDLINDLIFDSKVTSGNVTLDLAVIDLNAFIIQIIAEFESRLKEIGIKTVYNNSATNTNILADSSQLYRVFQNLFSNIFKYALEKSRVYIDLESVKSKIVITMKNIQKEKIEVNPDTLKDRFVRGSKSRTTEGFGLGLSISENLVKSMNGKLEISSNRDLFIVKLTFVSYE